MHSAQLGQPAAAADTAIPIKIAAYKALHAVNKTKTMGDSGFMLTV